MEQVLLLDLLRLLRHRRGSGGVELEGGGGALVIGVDGHGVAGVDTAELGTGVLLSIGTGTGTGAAEGNGGGGGGGDALVGAGDEAEVGKGRDRVAGGEDGLFFVVVGLVEGFEGGGRFGGFGAAEEKGVACVEGGEGVPGLQLFCGGC